MNTLPLETLQRIFELACTDGGNTGCSLSLVSKDIRAASRTARFHSVALAASPRRLQSFVALYEPECDPARGDKPRLRHLHVTFPRTAHVNDVSGPSWLPMRSRSLSPPPRSSSSEEDLGPLVISTVSEPPSGDTDTPSGAAASPSRKSRAVVYFKKVSGGKLQQRFASPSRTSAAAAIDPEVHDDPTATPEYLGAAQRLFRLVTPDLITLVLQCGFTRGGPLVIPLIERPFPLLQEVTFVGVADPQTLLAGGITTAPLFPAATHLYIAPAYSANFLHFWSANAPRVTHLGLSKADIEVRTIAEAVGVRIKPPRPLFLSVHGSLSNEEPAAGSQQSPVEPPPVPTYPSVRHLVLQPGPGPIGAWCGNAWIDYDQALEALRQVERDAAAAGLEVAEVEAPKDTKFSGYYERARRSWLERIDDSRDDAGCWGGNEKVVPWDGASESEE